MRKFYIIFLFCIAFFSKNYAQVDGPAVSIEVLKCQIEHRDSVLKTDMKLRIMVDSLKNQIIDYSLLTKSMEIRYQDIVRVVNNYELLLSTDTIVFSKTVNQKDVPQCLKLHIEIIEKIKKIRNEIEEVEYKINDVNQRLQGLVVNSKSVIRKEIEKDVRKLDELITEVEEMNLESLSNEQRIYFKPGLTERYNKFLIYFE